MNRERYDRRNALILGAGRSGEAAARLLMARQGLASVVDEQWRADRLSTFGAEGISCLTAEREHLPDGAYDLVVVSPAIPDDHPWVLAARDRGLAVISELELASVYWQGEVIAVTGSKGKSSVIKCLTDTLVLAGRKAVTAGNYGTPLCERVLECPDAGAGVIAVTEVSSFQMELTRTFAPRLAGILNIQADHLDRHKTMETYARMKRKIFQAQVPGTSKAFLPAGMTPEGIPAGVEVERFGTDEGADWRYTKGSVTHGEASIAVTGVFDNPVMGAAAALISAMLSAEGLSPQEIAKGFASYQPLPHRFQTLGQVDGVTFIDDSKATSLSATRAALQMVGGRVRLIAGGRLKEQELGFVKDALSQYALKVYLIGEAQEALAQAWGDALPCERCGTMAVAVQKAFSEAKPGDTILLSPGAASFDQYPGMGARGDDFATQMAALSSQKSL